MKRSAESPVSSQNKKLNLNCKPLLGEEFQSVLFSRSYKPRKSLTQIEEAEVFFYPDRLSKEPGQRKN